VAQPSQAEQTRYLMTPKELAEFLGIGRTSTYRLLASGEIPCLRIGRLRKVRRDDVIDFIDSRLEITGG
jgi:excisionase family DNA binding protein